MEKVVKYNLYWLLKGVKKATGTTQLICMSQAMDMITSTNLVYCLYVTDYGKGYKYN